MNTLINVGDICDFHSHFLPNIDDGSKSVEESLQMLDFMSECGIKRIVATPHFYAIKDTPQKFLERRKEAVEFLSKNYLKDIHPKIYLGAEVEFFFGMKNAYELKDLCIEGTNYLLIEMPFEKWTENEVEEVYETADNLGIIPIIAHIERYPYLNKNVRYAESMIQDGFVVQSNAEFFIEKKSKNLALKMLKKGQIGIIGSDSHNMGERKPNLDKAFDIIKESLDENVIEEIVNLGNIILAKAKSI